MDTEPDGRGGAYRMTCGNSPQDFDDLAGQLERCGKFLMYCLGKRRGQEKILRILWEQGEISQRELQELLGIQPGSMSEIAAKLESKGLIVRGRAEADRRKILLSLTEEGRAWLSRQNEDSVRKRRAELFSALTDQEQQMMHTLLEKLRVDWEQRFERRDDPAAEPSKRKEKNI